MANAGHNHKTHADLRFADAHLGRGKKVRHRLREYLAGVCAANGDTRVRRRGRRAERELKEHGLEM